MYFAVNMQYAIKSGASIQIYFEGRNFVRRQIDIDSLTWVPEARRAKNGDWKPTTGVEFLVTTLDTTVINHTGSYEHGLLLS